MPATPDSILEDVKKLLGFSWDYTAFDQDIILHINSVLTTLSQLGIGPADGYEVIDASQTWAEYLTGYSNFNAVKSYIYLRVRLLFDPPATSFAITSIQEQINQLEWRLNVQREGIV